MCLEGFTHLGANGEDRIQSHHRVLKDHADLVAANGAHLIVIAINKILSFENDLARVYVSWLRYQFDDGESKYRFPCPRLADDTKPFTFVDGEADIADGPKCFFAQGEIYIEVVDGK